MSKRKYEYDDDKENEELSTDNNLETNINESSSEGIVEENFSNDEISTYSDIFQHSEDQNFDQESLNEISEESNENELETLDIKNLIADYNLCKSFFDKINFANSVKILFIKFLNSYKNKKYIKNIRKMCSDNLESLKVSYIDISEYDETLLKLLDLYPEKTLNIFDYGLESVVKVGFPNYDQIKKKLHVRIIDLPVNEDIRSLRNNHLNKLVKIRGVVVRRTGVFPLFYIIKYTCLKCQAIFGPFIANNTKPSHCYECQSKGPFVVNSS
ncbi:dna replication licensing factor mcm2, partial [Vairimorpha apis BRL 01]